MFSPLQVGKQWFYEALRESVRLKKTSRKTMEAFEAHCVDSWVLANGWMGVHMQPDNKQKDRIRLYTVATEKGYAKTQDLPIADF